MNSYDMAEAQAERDTERMDEETHCCFCGQELEADRILDHYDRLVFCSDDCHQEHLDDRAGFDPGMDQEPSFADPGGNSALRAATEDNPRNLPCPSCGAPDRLTPADQARGYQCDSCAETAERGW